MPSCSRPETPSQQDKRRPRPQRLGITSDSAQQQKGGVGKTTTAANLAVLLAVETGERLPSTPTRSSRSPVSSASTSGRSA
ncbi:MAG: ParA family protein [Solirubrobacteraceae bacterium]